MYRIHKTCDAYIITITLSYKICHAMYQMRCSQPILWTDRKQALLRSRNVARCIGNKSP